MHASFIQWNFSFFSLPPVFIEYKHPEKSTRHQNCKFYNFIKQAQHTKDPCNCELSFDSFRFIHFHHWYTIDTYITLVIRSSLHLVFNTLLGLKELNCCRFHHHTQKILAQVTVKRRKENISFFFYPVYS